MSKYQYVISVDPNRTAAVVFGDSLGEVKFHGMYEPQSFSDYKIVIADAISCFDGNVNQIMAVVEDQYFYYSKDEDRARESAIIYKALIENATKWKCAFDDLGITCVKANVASWKEKLNVKTKQDAIARLKTDGIDDEQVADAYCIFLWGVDMINKGESYK